MTALPLDQEARDRALGPAESFHLEAPAGSGKTSVLLARFLTLLAQVDAPEELLAVTFTRKAAGELRTRVMDLLWQRHGLRPEASPLERQLHRLAAEVFRRHGDGAQLKLAPERLPIMTFHSFCAQLLRFAPQEAGVPLDFQLLEENDTRRLQQEALEELRRRLNARPAADPVRQALVRRLVRLNNDWRRLADELYGLLARRDSLEEFLELARRSRDPEAYREFLEQRFQLILSPLLQSLAAGLTDSPLGRRWPDFWQELQGAPIAADLPRTIPGAAPQDVPAWQAIAQVLLTQAGDLRKQLAPRQGFPASLDHRQWSELIQLLPAAVARRLKQCRDLAPLGTSPEEAAALQDLVILLGEALEAYHQRCTQQRALDFVALELAAVKLLTHEDPSDLLLRLDYRLKHVLVDEFQDTSQNQMDLLCRLLAGWQAGEGRTLMVVGDPKQSIYGWRQAKPRLFRESRRGLPCAAQTPLPLTPLLLETNFRASRTLIAWGNEIFGDTVMGAGTAGAEFHPAQPRPGAPAGPVPHLALFTGENDLTARETEGKWLARQVAEARAALRDQGSIGVLLFTRRHLPLYLQAFREAGLAVRVREGLKLAESRVAAHVHNLARALVRPQDEVAWAAVLRGPWAPQPLRVLVRVAQTAGDLWPERVRRFAGTEACPRELLPVAVSLMGALDQVGRRPLADVLEEWLNDTEAWPGLAAWEGPAGVANARAYLDLLAAAESGLPETTFRQADLDLEQAFQAPDPRAQDSPVEVLTVHGAKGLEFDQVFLPFLDWQPLQNESRVPPFLLEEIPGTGLSGLALAKPFVQEKQSPLYISLKNLKDERILDEARRVFYVAVTRARERLVLSGLAKFNRQGEWRASGNSPLGWLKEHYQEKLPLPGTPASWSGPELRVELLTEAPLPPGEEARPVELPAPWEFRPEAPPYQLSFPSRLAEPWAGAAAGDGSAAAEAGDLPRLKGEIIHRGLETLATGGTLPDLAALAAALRQGGLAPAAAAVLAPEIRAELVACQEDPFLAPLLNPDLPGARSEWLLEDRSAPDTIRRGKIDRLAFDGEHWWLLDYKTSRPETEDAWEEFMARETEKYRPQLEAYREMAAKAQGIAPETIRTVLYFTGRRRALEL